MDLGPFQRRLHAWSEWPWKVTLEEPGAPHLYNLAADPREAEERPWAAPGPDMLERMKAYLGGIPRAAVVLRGGAPPTSPTQRHVRALGY